MFGNLETRATNEEEGMYSTRKVMSLKLIIKETKLAFLYYELGLQVQTTRIYGTTRIYSSTYKTYR